MIAHWPDGIKRPGTLSRFPSHLVDLMPTVVELAGADHPDQYQGAAILPMEGESLVQAMTGPAEQRSRPLYGEFSGNHAVRDARWKLVAERSRDGELYELSQDRSETRDLAAQHPDQVARLATMYDEWARRTGARPHARSQSLQPSSQSQLFELL